MTSRYDYFSESDVTDTDGEAWPDPLSVTYNDVQLTKAPPQYNLTDADITKFWLFMKRQYGIQELDDILLNINAIPYLGMERPGDAIYLLELEDMKKFNTQKLGESEDY